MKAFRTAALLLVLCAPAAALAELRTYDVDFKYRQEVFEALRNVVVQAELGRVELLPTGQILIDAEAPVHAEVEAVLEGVAARQAETAPRVRLRYWVVLGAPNAADAGDLPPPLTDVLAELEQVHGDLGFRVLGTAALVTESGQDGELSGRPVSVEQRAHVQGTTLNAEIEMRFTYAVQSGERRQLNQQGVEVNTTVEAGEFVVLSESMIDDGTIGELNGQLFYIVHWPRTE